MLAQREHAGNIIGGSILIGLGVLFLLGQFFNFVAMSYLWPFIIIGVGGLFFIGMLVGGKSSAALAIPATIISGVGLMFLLQTLTGHWESWAYGWTVILMLVGLGIWIMGWWGDNPRQRYSGGQVVKVGFVFFLIFGALVEFVFFGNGAPVMRQIVFPVLLILVGVYLVVRRTFWPAQPISPATNPPLNNPDTPPVEPQPTQPKE